MSRLVPPTSVITAAVTDSRGGLGKKPDVLLDGRGEDDEVVAAEVGDTLHGPIDRAAARSMREHCRTIDRRDADRRPAFADRERDRTADQAEADDGDL